MLSKLPRLPLLALAIDPFRGAWRARSHLSCVSRVVIFSLNEMSPDSTMTRRSLLLVPFIDALRVGASEKIRRSDCAPSEVVKQMSSVPSSRLGETDAWQVK